MTTKVFTTIVAVAALCLATVGCRSKVETVAAKDAESTEQAGETNETPSDPTASTPEKPVESAPGNAAESAADDSGETTSDQAAESTPEKPEESATEEPAESKPDEPGESTSDAPAATTPDEPVESTADGPAETTPDQVAKVEPAPEPKAEEITREWTQWCGSAQRNNTPVGKNIPISWVPGEFSGPDRQWQKDTAKNVKWVANLGSQTYGNVVVAGGKCYVGTNNASGYLERYPSDVDLGCLICFDIADGKFLWQHSSEKLKTGRVHDWPLQGICCAPLVEGERLWFVTSRGEVRCLDTEGFLDDENDGPFKSEDNENKDEADVVWVFDMMKELGTSQHNMCSCSVTSAGDLLFVNTSNGLDESHILLPAPDAPSFFAMNKNTGEVLWTDKSPGENILHGQWSSPAYAVLGGVPQVIFGGGDGWVYSFLAEGEDGKSKLLWKFDANPKESKWILGGRGTRNNIIATPVIYKDHVYVAVGQDPEHAEGIGHLWCINPAKKLDGSDVSPQKVYKIDDPTTPIPHRRIQACNPEDGEVARDNPDSAVVWHYTHFDQNGDGQIDWEEEMHRSCGTVAIKDDILYIADFSGLFHCLNALTGEVYWTHDMLAAAWGSPLIVEDKVYIGDEDGDVLIFKLSKEEEILSRDEDGEPGPINMGTSVYSTPVVADNVLYISDKNHLFAIAAEGAEVAKAGEGE